MVGYHKGGKRGLGGSDEDGDKEAKRQRDSARHGSAANEEDLAHMDVDRELELENQEEEDMFDEYLMESSSPSKAEEAPSLEDGDYGRNWCRPPLAEKLDASTQPLVFQQLELDYVLGPAHDKYHRAALKGCNSVPVIRMYGVSREGNSTCAFIHGFEPYFYAEMPSGFTPDDIDELRKQLEARLASEKRFSKFGSYANITSIEIEHKKSVWGYNPGAPKPFLKITTLAPNLVATARKTLENGLSIPGLGLRGFPTYESNVQFILRFMIDCDIVGGNWLEFPKG